jgi:hypothetical protein
MGAPLWPPSTAQQQPPAGGQGEREAAPPPPPPLRGPAPVLTGGPQGGLPQACSFDEWLSASVHQAAHHYKTALVSLARQNQVDTARLTRSW